jgi:DNA-binding transcriptional LysR family regulator
MNFRNLDLNLLRVFDAVMAERSLTRAAASLSLSQSAVSHALKRLREAVGDALVTRTAFGVVPTPRAQALWPTVRAALGQLQQAVAPGEFDPRTDHANFRLAMADATAATWMPPLVAAIEKAQALANVQVVPLTTRDPRGLLERDEAALALGYFPAAMTAIVAQDLESPLRHQRLSQSEYQCVMRKGHPLARGELTLDRYCEAHHLLVSFSGRPYGAIDAALAALGRRRRIVLTVNQFFTAGRVVTQSNLLTVLPSSFIAATGYQDSLVARPVPVALGGIQIEMLWHMRNDGKAAHRWLRDQLLAASRERVHDTASEEARPPP